MTRPTPKFAPDEVVFAKIKGFAPWPAKVEFYENIPSTNKVKYNVYFYGTNQIGQCKEEDLFPYIEYRDKFGRPKKLLGFMKAISQADVEIGLQRPITKFTSNVADRPRKVSTLTHLEYLKAELQILKIDRDIKKSLNTHKPQLDTCLKLLNEYSETIIDPLIFKKNPKLIDTLIKLQVYSSDVSDNLSDETKIELIRKKARNIYHIIQSIFYIPQGKTFPEVLAEELKEFQRSIETMTDNEVLQLSTDPTSSR